MIDFEAARAKMVDNQIRTTDVTSHSVLSAFLTVPREAFVPAGKEALAYIDTDIAVGTTQGVRRFVMEASPLAKLLQLAGIGKEDRVLEIGTGTGYATALLSLLGGSVVSVECDEALASAARETLARLGHDNVEVVSGSLEAGAAAKGPYDVIFINGAVEEIPQALVDQLKDGGRLVAVEGYGNASRAQMVVRDRGIASRSAYFNTAVQPLPGFRKERVFAL